MENNNEYTNAQPPVSSDYSDKLKWHKFLIYFALWAGAVLNVISGIRILTGSIYGVDVDAVYRTYGGLKTIDVLYGLLLCALAVYQIYLRFQLAGFKKEAPGKLSMMYIITILLGLAYMLVVSAVTRISISALLDSSTVGSYIGSIVFLFINKAYYGKRSHLFVN